MENCALSLGRYFGHLRSKLDVRQYALEVALTLPGEDKLKKTKEIESYLLNDVELPGYFDPNQTTNDLLKKVAEMSVDKNRTYVFEKNVKEEAKDIETKAEDVQKTDENPM